MRATPRRILLAGLLLSFALEVVSRWQWPSESAFEKRFPVGAVRQPVPYSMFRGAPNAMLADPPERLNRRGYRGREPVRPKPRGELRVFWLGGSAVFAGDPPLSVLVEQDLRRRGFEQVRCYNYGVVSSVSGMDLARLVFEVMDLEPDLLVVYNGGNDLILPAVYDPRPGFPFNFIVYENNPLLRGSTGVGNSLIVLAHQSNLLRRLFPSFFARTLLDLEGSRTRAGYGSAPWREEIARTYVANLVKIQRISRASGADCVGFVQPLIFFKDKLGLRETTLAQRAGPLLPALALELREGTRQELERARGQDGLAVVDLSDLFDTVADDVFVDPVHLDAHGQELVSAATVEHLLPRITLAARPRPAP